MAAELVHAHLESRNSSQRRFFEEHGDVLAVESVRDLTSVNFSLETRGNLDGFENFFFTPVGQAEEVFVAIYHLVSFGVIPISRLIYESTDVFLSLKLVTFLNEKRKNGAFTLRLLQEITRKC